MQRVEADSKKKLVLWKNNWLIELTEIKIDLKQICIAILYMCIDFIINVYFSIIILNRYILAQSGLINVHCIGHSLGAHACGFLGKRFIKNNNIKIWRISVWDLSLL